MNRNKILNIIKYVAITVILIGILGFAGIALWGSFPLKATQTELDMAYANDKVVIQDKSSYYSIVPKDFSSKIGIIYYPGGRVSPDAYLYKMSEISANDNIAIFITKPIFNFAIFGINDANKIKAAESEISIWYLGGHSLGGSMACQFLSNQKNNDFAGLILFGSYCASDISKSNYKVISISGSNDGLVTSDKLAKYKTEIPAENQFKIIEGMNHAQNGNYGKQDGDKVSSAADSEVITQMSEIIKEFINLQ